MAVLVKVLVAPMALVAMGCGSQAGLGGDDQDGIVGGNVTFVVTVDDTGFSHPILKAQNLANITVTLTNAGSVPHGFRVECMGAACFPDTARMEPLAPGATATAMFMTPRTEGTYPVTANDATGVRPAQFIVQ